MKSDYDLVVIGSGNAGQAAAEIARDAGWSVLVVESRDVGGTCPLRGCVPKKVLVAAAEVFDQITRAPAHRIRVGKPRLDWPKLIARKQTFVAGVPAAMEKGLKQRGIDVLHGRARFVGTREVAVGGRRIAARKILVSNGSKPRRLPIPGAESVPWATAVRDDGTFKSPDELRRLYEGKGVTADKEVRAYCRIGERSAGRRNLQRRRRAQGAIRRQGRHARQGGDGVLPDR